MHKGPIFFIREGDVYQAEADKRLINITKNKTTPIVVREIVKRVDGKYGILLFGNLNEDWPKQFDAEAVEI